MREKAQGLYSKGDAVQVDLHGDWVGGTVIDTRPTKGILPRLGKFFGFQPVVVETDYGKTQDGTQRKAEVTVYESSSRIRPKPPAQSEGE